MASQERRVRQPHSFEAHDRALSESFVFEPWIVTTNIHIFSFLNRNESNRNDHSVGSSPFESIFWCIFSAQVLGLEKVFEAAQNDPRLFIEPLRLDAELKLKADRGRIGP